MQTPHESALLYYKDQGSYTPALVIDEIISYSNWAMYWTGLTENHIDVLFNTDPTEWPEAEGYWDTWKDILANVRYTDLCGNVYKLVDMCDIYLLPEHIELPVQIIEPF